MVVLTFEIYTSPKRHSPRSRSSKIGDLQRSRASTHRDDGMTAPKTAFLAPLTARVSVVVTPRAGVEGVNVSGVLSALVPYIHHSFVFSARQGELHSRH